MSAPTSILTAAIVGRWVLLLGGVFAFGRLATRLHETGSLGFDGRALAWLRARQGPRLTRTVMIVTDLGSAELLTPLSVLATLGLAASGKRRAASFVAVTAAGSTVMNQVLKLVFARARPDAAQRLSSTTGFAFPSGHSMSSAAIYGALAVVAATRYPRLGGAAMATCAVVVGAVGASRAYLQVHFPSDILAGWVLGLAWPFSLRRLMLG